MDVPTATAGNCPDAQNKSVCTHGLAAVAAKKSHVPEAGATGGRARPDCSRTMAPRGMAGDQGACKERARSDLLPGRVVRTIDTNSRADVGAIWPTADCPG